MIPSTPSLPPRYMPWVYGRLPIYVGFSFPTARRFSSKFTNSCSRRFIMYLLIFHHVIYRAACSCSTMELCARSHAPHHPSHVTHHPSRSHIVGRIPSVTRHASHVTRHASHATCQLAPVTRHVPHVTRHASPATRGGEKGKVKTKSTTESTEARLNVKKISIRRALNNPELNPPFPSSAPRIPRIHPEQPPSPPVFRRFYSFPKSRCIQRLYGQSEVRKVVGKQPVRVHSRNRLGSLRRLVMDRRSVMRGYCAGDFDDTC